MSKRVAICIPTYNRSDVVMDVIEKNMSYWMKYSFDVYIYDSSTGNETELIVKKAMESMPFIKYIRISSDIHSNSKVYMIFQQYGIEKQYDYIWLMADYIIFHEDVWKKVVDNVESDADMYVIQYKDVQKLGDKTYTDKIDVFKDLSWHLTWYGATIVKVTSLLNDINWDYLSKKYLVEDKINFSHVGFYLETFANMDKLVVKHVVVNNTHFKVSPYRVSPGWKKDIFITFFEYWPNSIMALPTVYNKYKKRVIHSLPKYAGLTTSQQLILFKKDNIYDWKIYKRYFGRWHFLSNVSEIIAFSIAVLPKEIFESHLERSLRGVKSYFLLKKKERILLYGAGMLGRIYSEYLSENNIEFEGFVVSDNENIAKMYLGKPILKFSEIEQSNFKGYIILSLKREFVEEVMPVLFKAGFHKVRGVRNILKRG